MRRGFTIVELLVAIGILVALLTASGVIFSMAVDAQRAASATGEITEKLQAIREQLDSDFGGLLKDEALAIWFEVNPVDEEGDGVIDRYERFDQILCFATGDFQTVRQYNDGAVVDTVWGDTARVYYGHADKIDYTNRTAADKALVQRYPEFKTLARREHVLTSNAGLAVFPDITDATTFANTFIPINNDLYEYDTIGNMSLWANVLDYIDGVGEPVNSERVLETCFNNDNVDGGRAGIDLKEPLTLHMLMCQGVGSFKIQWSYNLNGQVWWFPSSDPDGDDNEIDSDFGSSAMDKDGFGVYFEMPGGINVDMDGDVNNDWYSVYYDDDGDGLLNDVKTAIASFPPNFYPEALKFTFTLYDSNGIFKEGKTFTHIVNLN